MMNNPIRSPLDFLEQLRSAIKDKLPIASMEQRACVITRSPACYGREGSVIIEWEGTPPRFTICYLAGSIPVVEGGPIKWQQMVLVNSIIRRFLDAHPAKEDGTPVWIEPSRKKEPSNE